MNTSHSRSLKAKAHYEAIVIGGRLSGLIAAKLLSQRGLNVALIHRDQDWGQEFQAINTPAGTVCQGLGLLPDLPGARDLIKILEAELNLSLPLEKAEALQTFEGGQFKSFLGFGENAPEGLDILEPYLASEYASISGATLVQLIAACSQGEGLSLLSPHEVTGLNLSAEGWEVEVDAQTLYLADHVYYADSPAKLLQLLRHDGTKPSKDLRRLGKWQAWSSVTLTLVHQAVICDRPESPFLLMGSKLQPALGLFDPPLGGGQQVSRWISFLPSELAEAEEHCATAYKEMKKQIKRAFPKALEGPLWEKITVQSQSHGYPQLSSDMGELKLGPQLFPLGSAFCAHPQFLWGELLSPLGIVRAEADKSPQNAGADQQDSSLHI